MGTLLLGSYLLGEQGQARKGWGVAFHEDTIEETGPNGMLKEKYPRYEVLDCTGKIISPGFVNAHMHCYGVLAHGITVPARIDSFESFLDDFWWPLVENRIDYKMIEVTTRNAVMELLASGVTSFCDVLEAPYAVPGALETQARVLDETGMRGVLSFEACQRISDENGLQGLNENRDFYLNYQRHPRISGMMCIHTTFTCDKDFIRKAKALAREAGSGIQMHLSESKYEPAQCLGNHGNLPVELYDELGILGSDVLASQGVKLEEREIDIIARRGMNIVHVPLSNCEVGGGVSPVPKLLDKKITVALGTDGYINNFFEVMRGAFLIHKAFSENPEVMPAETVFTMATEFGGRALRKWKTGVLKAGYKADIITIEPALPTPLNADNIYDQLILYCNPVNVKEVFVNGRLLKKGGRLPDFDEQAVRKDVQEQALRLWEDIR